MVATDPYGARRARQEAARQEVRRRKARRYIERTQPPGEATVMLLEALGLNGPRYAPNQCPHCLQPFTGGRHRCQKVACVRAAREVRHSMDLRIREVASG